MYNTLITQKDNTTVGPANGVESLSAGGLFTQVSQDPVISAVVGLKMGFESMLPAVPSLIENPQVKIITGIEEASAASGLDCGKYPEAGGFKLCHINDYPFGKYGMKSRSIDLTEVGLVSNNWTNQNQPVVGNPFGPDGKMNAAPTGVPSYADIARNTTAKIFNEMAFSATVTYGRQCLYGNPANNDPATSSVREMRGLSLLINDNYSDAVTGVDCDRVDSIVINNVGLTVENDTSLIVQRVVDTLAVLEQRKYLMGDTLSPWINDGFAVMHFNLFRKLVNNWPDTYYSYRTAANTSTISNLDGVALQNMRRDMLNGGYLITDRGNLRVITDPAVIEDAGTIGTTSSDIWFINREFMGQRTSYVEYLPFNKDTTALGAYRSMLNENKFKVTDNGRFLVWGNTEGTCIRTNMVYRSRLRIDAPFLCAVMTNVEYSPDQVIQETPFPGDAGYLNGGVTGPYAGADGTVVNITACVDNAPGILDFTVDEAFSCTEGGTVNVIVGNNSIPGIVTGTGTTSITVDFTAIVFYSTVVCADFTFVGGQVVCPYQVQ